MAAAQKIESQDGVVVSLGDIVGLTGKVRRRMEVTGADVSREPWLARPVGLASGNDYAVDDIARQPLLGGATVATYAASVREGGRADGKPIGVLAVHFDWEPQARAIVKGVRLTDSEKTRTRVLLVDASKRVIAASDEQGILSEKIQLDTAGRPRGLLSWRPGRGRGRSTRPPGTRPTRGSAGTA